MDDGRDVVIVGVGETPIGRHPGRSTMQLQALAALEAVRDAGLELSDVDGVFNLDPYATPHSMYATALAGYLGVPASFVSTVDVGGSVTGMTMLQTAAWAIAAGQCEVAVCVYGENILSARAPGVRGAHLHNLTGSEEWEEPFGVQGMVIPYALLAQRYLAEHGGSVEDLAAVALVQREHALLNDNARMKTPLSLEEYLAAEMISSPLRLFDCSIPSDGSGALVLTTGRRARALGRRGARLRSLAVRATHATPAEQPDITALGMADAARRAFESAGLGPEDLDVALLHDAFTVSVLVTLDAMGVTEPGGAGAWLRGGFGSLGGELPVNTHGGLLSQGHVGGMLHFVEAVRQLRGEAGSRQVDGARLAAVSGNGGVFSVCGVLVLEAHQP